jgi:hypothetical protein
MRVLATAVASAMHLTAGIFHSFFVASIFQSKDSVIVPVQVEHSIAAICRSILASTVGSQAARAAHVFVAN